MQAAVQRAIQVILSIWLSCAVLPQQAFADPAVRAAFQQDAPADALTYWEGSLSAIAMGTWSPNATQQVEQVIGQIQSLKSELSPEAVGLIVEIMRDYLQVISSTPSALADHYGLQPDQDMALYLDGLAPIIHVAVRSPEAIRTIVMRAVNASGSPLTTATWNGHEVFLWEVVREPHLGFAIVFEPQRVTFGLYSEHDTQARTWRRLGLTPEVHSVYSEGTLAAIQQQYPFSGVFEGFVDFRQWVAFLSQKPNNTPAQDWQLYDPISQEAPSVNCQQEYQALAEQVPFFAAGYEAFDLSDKGLEARVSGHLAIKQQSSTAGLMSLNGHLSAHATQAWGQMLSIAVGLDTQGVLAAVTPIWQAVANARFSCPQLQALQAQIGPYSPATLAVMLALTQGIQGAALSVVDITGLFEFPNIQTIDALLTVTSAQPAALPALLAMLPQMQGMRLPVDDTPVPLHWGDLPKTLTPMASIQGNHLAITLGPKSAEKAKTLATEPLNHRGWLGLAADSDLMSKQLFDPIVSFTATNDSLEALDCINLTLGAAALRDSHFRLNFQAGVETQGIGFTVNQSLRPGKQKPVPVIPLGDFELASMGDGCRWNPSGTETLTANGEGAYTIQAPFAACSTWRARYQWQQRGSRMFYVETEAMGREQCDDAMVAQEPSQYDCVILQSDKDSFHCLFQYEGGDMDLFRYTLKEQ